MERKILLRKIEIKKVKNNLENNKDMAETGSENSESESSFENNMPESEILVDIAVEKHHNAVKIYPQNKAMSNVGNQLADGHSKLNEKLESGNVYIEKENKYPNLVSNIATADEIFQSDKSESYTKQTCSSNSSSLLPSSLVLLELESSADEFNELELKEESNVSAEESATENKMFFDNSTASDVSICDKSEIPKKSLTSQLANNKMTITDCNGQKKCITATKMLDENDVKIDKSKTSLKKQENPLSSSVVEDEMRDLREALDGLTTCLLGYLEAFHIRILNLENLSLERNLNLNFQDDISKCQYREKYTQIQIKRGNTIADSLPKLRAFKNSSIRNGEEGLDDNACLIPADTSKIVYMKPSESCVCGFCDDFQSTRKNFSSGDHLEEIKVAEKKTIGPSASNNENLENIESNFALKRRHLKSKKRDAILPFSVLPGKVKKVMRVKTNETESDVKPSAHNSNAEHNDSFQNCVTTTLNPISIHKEHTEEYCHKKNRKSKSIRINVKNDQLKRHEDKKCKEAIENEDEDDNFEILFFVYLFIISSLSSLLLYIYICYSY